MKIFIDVSSQIPSNEVFWWYLIRILTCILYTTMDMLFYKEVFSKKVTTKKMLLVILRVK